LPDHDAHGNGRDRRGEGAVVTYGLFLFVFILPAIALAGCFARLDRRFFVVLLGLLAVVLAATFPWDAQALKWGIWRFDETKICGVRAGIVPLEECAFFGLQTILVALVYRALGRR
jgi:lycopene cyclase domain-containing protein